MLDLSSFDFLSPRITLYQKGKIRHSSKFSGLLTLISYLLFILISIYYSLDIIYHRKLVASYYKSFHNETGYFPFNYSSLYHFIQFMNLKTDIIPFNSKFLRIKGIRNLSYSIYPDEIKNEDHWIYDLCDNSNEKEVNKLKENNVQNKIEILKGACLKYYYNSTEKKYYKYNTNNYSPPYLIHGNSRPDNKFYSIIIEKCRNNSMENLLYGENSCGSNEEMDIYFKNLVAVYLQIIDHNVDIHNYKNPIKSVLYPISSSLKGKDYAQHNLNFSPLIFRTHRALIFNHDDEQTSFIYDDNRKSSRENTNYTHIYCEFVFWMQNVFHIYERSYKSISDLLASIGGIFEAISTLATWINYYYHRYIIKYDSLILFGEKERKILLSTGLNLNHKDLNNGLNIKSISNKMSFNSNLNFHLMKNDDNHNFSNLKLINSKIGEKNKTNNYIKQEIKKLNTFSKMKLNFNFKFTFISFLLPCKNDNKKNCLNIIKSFRKKLLSEEHLYRNHLDLYFLEHICENKENVGMNEIYKKL